MYFYILFSDCFSPCANFKTVAVLNLLALGTIEAYIMPASLHLSLDTLLWLINAASPLATVLCSLLLAPRLASSTTTAAIIHADSPPRFRPLPLRLFLFMALVPYLPIVYSIVIFVGNQMWAMLFYSCLYNWTYVPVSQVEAQVSCKFYVAERAFADIRRQLVALEKQTASLKAYSALKELFEKYLEVAKFCSEMNRGYSIHFLNMYVSFALRMIVYAAYYVQFSKVYSFDKLLVVAVYAAYQVTRLLFLCHRCEKLKEEVSMSYI